MRDYDVATVDFLQSRAGVVAHRLIWISARNTATGLIEDLGLWSGEDNMGFTIGGQSRDYIGAGVLLDPEPITSQPGLDVRIHQLRMAAIAPKVEELVKGYDTRFAPVEMHRALFHPDTRQLVAEPHRIYKGMIDQITFPREVPGGSPACVVSVASETRILTRTLASKKSNESHVARNGGDGFRQYAVVSGSVSVFWGEKKLDPPAEPTPAPPSGGGSTVPRTGDDRDFL